MAKQDELNKDISSNQRQNERKPICGIVMPISSIDGCSEAHWADVHTIIKMCIREADFEPNLVSNADEIGVIQKRIIQNLYDNPIVVCDVSGKNPNVMFELGIRLAFDKPTIIIKDDKTSYSFDTAQIEHIVYPRDLRYNLIEDFKILLTEKISQTYRKASSDPDYTTFLKHFGEFKLPKIVEKEVTHTEYIMDELRTIRNLIGDPLNNASLGGFKRSPGYRLNNVVEIVLRALDSTEIAMLDNYLLNFKNIVDYKIKARSDSTNLEIYFSPSSDAEINKVLNIIQRKFSKANPEG